MSANGKVKRIVWMKGIVARSPNGQPYALSLISLVQSYLRYTYEDLPKFDLFVVPYYITILSQRSKPQPNSLRILMAYPKVVAFDLDGCAWSNWLNPNAIGLRGWAGRVPEDNLRIEGTDIIDRYNRDQRVTVSSDFCPILAGLFSRGVKIAITSRNTHMNLCTRAMWLINVKITREAQPIPLTDIISYNEIYDSSKQIHLERISGWSGASYHEMLMFDDQAHNNDVEMWQGATFQKVSNGDIGITKRDYRAGLDTWRRNQEIRRPIPTAGLNPHPNARQIGWVGTDLATGSLYMQGKRRTKSSRPSRWGWGIYVADDPSIAAEFARWGRKNEPDNQYICKIFVRDYDVFLNMHKVWVPEFGAIPQTYIREGDKHISDVQIRRDNIISDTFGVRKPYILFSRHHWMDFLAMTWRQNHRGRFSEMVLYPQIQDALFYGRDLWKISDVKPWIDNGSLEGFDFRHKLAEWNIQSNRETKQDFKSHGEDFY